MQYLFAFFLGFAAYFWVSTHGLELPSFDSDKRLGLVSAQLDALQVQVEQVNQCACHDSFKFGEDK